MSFQDRLARSGQERGRGRIGTAGARLDSGLAGVSSRERKSETSGWHPTGIDARGHYACARTPVDVARCRQSVDCQRKWPCYFVRVVLVLRMGDKDRMMWDAIRGSRAHEKFVRSSNRKLAGLTSGVWMAKEPRPWKCCGHMLAAIARTAGICGVGRRGYRRYSRKYCQRRLGIGVLAGFERSGRRPRRRVDASLGAGGRYQAGSAVLSALQG